MTSSLSTPLARIQRVLRVNQTHPSASGLRHAFELIAEELEKLFGQVEYFREGTERRDVKIRHAIRSR
jgi:hypothetical protein